MEGDLLRTPCLRTSEKPLSPPPSEEKSLGVCLAASRTCVKLTGLQERRAAPRRFVASVKYVTRRSPPGTVRARARSPCGRLTSGVQRHPRAYPSSTSTCRSINTWHGGPQKPSSRLWRAVYARSCKWTSENTPSRHFGEYPVLYDPIVHHDDSAARAEMGALHVAPTSNVITTTPRPARADPAPRRAP